MIIEGANVPFQEDIPVGEVHISAERSALAFL